MTEQITLGGGCFWCIESAFNKVKGVLSAYSGYSNGHTFQPSYQDVCTGDTGHNEVVQVTFDSEVINLKQIFEIFLFLSYCLCSACASESDKIDRDRDCALLRRQKVL